MEWLFKPAKWYQFWLPQSGFVGGLIVGGSLGTAIYVLLVLAGKL